MKIIGNTTVTLAAVLLWGIVIYLAYLLQASRNFQEYIFSLMPDSVRYDLTCISRDSVSRLYDLQVYDEEELLINARVKSPETDGKYPGMVLLGGMMTGRKAVEYSYRVDDVVMVAPDYPYMVRYSYSFLEILTDMPEAKKSMYLQVRDNLLLFRFLKGFGPVDSSQIGLVGYSFGVPFAVATAGVGSHPDFMALVYGGGDFSLLLETNFHRYGDPWDALLIGLFRLHLFDFEPLEHMKRVEDIPMILINGKADEKIPPESALMLHRKAPPAADIVWLESKHVHTRNIDLSLRIIRELRQWFDTL